MSGCAVCVYDLYDEALSSYKQSMHTLRASLRAMNVPESEWPQSVSGAAKHQSAQNAYLDAFQQLEKSLKAKKEQQQRE